MWNMFDPITTYKNLLKRWWIIVLIAIVGGLIAYGISFLKPQKYEAEAVFHASLDFTKINFESMQGAGGGPLTFTQYDEDIALQVVQRMLRATRTQAFEYAQTLDPTLELHTFVRNLQIRRYHAQWYLRYRHTDPAIAQDVVNFWADLGWQTMQIAQNTGRAEEFVILDLVSLADLPQEPIYHNRNMLVLSGTIIGFLIGILIIDLTQRYGAGVKGIE